jgi:hypothetical protein
MHPVIVSENESATSLSQGAPVAILPHIGNLLFLVAQNSGSTRLSARKQRKSLQWPDQGQENACMTASHTYSTMSKGLFWAFAAGLMAFIPSSLNWTSMAVSCVIQHRKHLPISLG